MKTVLFVIAIIATVAYFNDPSSLKPWGKAIGELGNATAKVVKSVGEGTHETLRGDHDVVDKVMDTTDNAVSAVKDAVQ